MMIQCRLTRIRGLNFYARHTVMVLVRDTKNAAARPRARARR